MYSKPFEVVRRKTIENESTFSQQILQVLSTGPLEPSYVTHPTCSPESEVSCVTGTGILGISVLPSGAFLEP